MDLPFLDIDLKTVFLVGGKPILLGYLYRALGFALGRHARDLTHVVAKHLHGNLYHRVCLCIEGITDGVLAIKPYQLTLCQDTYLAEHEKQNC